MDVFFTDIDNTLIYSHRHMIPGEKIVVEHIDGREQSYMTRYTYAHLKSFQWLLIVPVTTRTEEQYKRLQYLDLLGIHISIVCNGGKLLIDGVEDKKWSDESYRLANSMRDSLEQAARLLKKHLDGLTVHHPESYMYYVKCENPKMVCESIRRNVDTNSVEVFHDTHKVYLFAACISKGNAIRRFEEQTNIRRTVAAGDDIADISMMDMVDYALVTEKIYDRTSCKNKLKMKGFFISNQICETLSKLHTQGILT